MTTGGGDPGAESAEGMVSGVPLHFKCCLKVLEEGKLKKAEKR